MQYVEIHNPDAQLLIDWTAHQMRMREVMIRRRLLPWRVRKTPEIARDQLLKIDAIFRENARNYMKSAP